MPRASHHHPQVRHEHKTDVELVAGKGVHYRDAFTEAIHTACRLEREVSLTFNGVVLGVRPTSTVGSLTEEFCAKYLSPRDPVKGLRL